MERILLLLSSNPLVVVAVVEIVVLVDMALFLLLLININVILLISVVHYCLHSHSALLAVASACLAGMALHRPVVVVVVVVVVVDCSPQLEVKCMMIGVIYSCSYLVI
jgi:hypothetical protein